MADFHRAARFVLRESEPVACIPFRVDDASLAAIGGTRNAVRGLTVQGSTTRPIVSTGKTPPLRKLLFWAVAPVCQLPLEVGRALRTLPTRSG